MRTNRVQDEAISARHMAIWIACAAIAAWAVSLGPATFSASATSASEWGPGFKGCGSFKAAYTIQVFAKDVSCGKARRIQKEYWRAPKGRTEEVNDGGAGYVLLKRFPGWKCVSGAGGGSCTKGARVAAYSDLGSARIVQGRAPATDVTAAARRAHHHHRKPKKPSRIGEVLTSGAENNDVCLAAMNATSWASNDVFNGPTLLPGGNLLMGCGLDIDGGPEMIVAYDALNFSIRWKKRMVQGAAYQTTYNYLFKLWRRVTPAHGLTDPSVREFVSAYSMRTGKEVWQAVLPALGFADRYSKGPGNAPIEGPSGAEGSPPQVVIQDSGTQAFDPATGALLWATPTESFNNIGSSTLLEYGGEGPAGEEGVVRALDARTGATRWTGAFERCADDRDTETVGTVRWELGGGCVRAFDILTGAQTFFTSFPEEWRWSVPDRTGVVAATDKTLSYYKLGNLATPVWSEPATRARPIIVAKEHALIETYAGLFIVVSLENGKVVAELGTSPSWHVLSFRQGPVDGLVSVTRENGYTNVLDLDHP
jgi:outer membrane protein assembly factor BamB